jgi:hypothetical protein
MAGAKAAGELPVLALDVVDDGRAGPGQKGGQHQAHALARSGRGKAQAMLGAVVAQIGLAELAQDHAGLAEQASGLGLARRGPTRGAVGVDIGAFAGAPNGHGDGRCGCKKAARRSHCRAAQEDARRVGVIDEPPPEEGGRGVDPVAAPDEPGWSQRLLVGQLGGGPLGRRPHGDQDDQANEENLAPEDPGGGH